MGPERNRRQQARQHHPFPGWSEQWKAALFPVRYSMTARASSPFTRFAGNCLMDHFSSRCEAGTSSSRRTMAHSMRYSPPPARLQQSRPYLRQASPLPNQENPCQIPRKDRFGAGAKPVATLIRITRSETFPPSKLLLLVLLPHGSANRHCMNRGCEEP